MNDKSYFCPGCGVAPGCHHESWCEEAKRKEMQERETLALVSTPTRIVGEAGALDLSMGEALPV